MEPLYQLPGSVSRFKQAVRRYLLLALAACTAAFWIGGQLFASRLEFHPALGKAWIAAPASTPEAVIVAALLVLGALCAGVLLGRLPRRALPVFAALLAFCAALLQGPVYSPVHLIVWHRRFAAVQPVVTLLSPYWTAALVVSALALAAAVAGILMTPRSSKPDIHGSARFAARKDLEQARLLHPVGESVVGPPGLFLGCWTDESRRRFALYDDHDTHVFAFAPTRTGKGVSLVIPNLLLWRGSILAVDVKSELFALTSGYRSAELGNRCYRFDPTVPGTSRYNPLVEVRLGINEVRDAQNIADVLVDPNGDRPRDHWDRTAHDLLTAVILHVLYAEPQKTLSGCAGLLSRPGTDVTDTLRSMVRHRHLPGGSHPVIASIAQAVLDKSADERSGVISTALSFLALYRDPLIAANTAASDFTIGDLMGNERPLSLYLTLPPSDLSRTRPLVRLLLNQICRRLTEPALTFVDGQPLAHYNHKLLLMMDELPALGRLAFFAESLAYLAGYGIRAVLIAQDLSQLQGAYGPKESITSNAHHRIAFAPNKPETAELVSQMAGTMTVHQQRRTSRPGAPLFSGGVSLTPSESHRRLLTSDEAMRLPPDQSLIFAAGLPAIRGLKAPYYLDAELKRRASFPPATPLTSSSAGLSTIPHEK